MSDSAVKVNPNNIQNQKHPHSAIPSWSGFVYQGKVALLHSIHLISQKGDLAKNYKLQLDSIEDFAILNSNDEPLSIHQVKAVNKDSFSSYKEAFDKQKKKAREYPNAKVFFHTAVEIKNKIPAGFEVIELYDYKRILNNSEEGKYCPLNSIDSEIDKRINLYFETHHAEQNYRQGSSYIERCRSSLEQTILKQVIKIHAKNHNGVGKNQAAFEEKIKFETIYSILNDDLNEEIETEDYFLWRLRGDLSSYYQQYCFDTSLNIDDRVKISKYMVMINDLDTKKMKQFIHSILPHRKARFRSLIEYKNEGFQKDEIRLGLFTILTELREADGQSNTQIYWQHERARYTPTAIREGNRSADGLCLQIIKNAKENGLDVLYRNGKLITLEMDVSSISVSANNILDMSEEDASSKHSSYERINRWNKVSFISLDKAKEVINA